MELSKSPTDLFAALRQGIDELSCLDTDDQVLQHALKLSLSLLGDATGYIMRRIVGDTWELDGDKSIQISPEIIEKLFQDEGLNDRDELYRHISGELQDRINRILPIKVEGVLMAALLFGEKGNRGVDPGQETSLSLISRYVSLLLSNIQLKEAIRAIRGHYEEILVKKETAEKLASLGTVAAGLAHEIKNPLVSIKTLAQLLPERFDDPEFRDHFATIAINEVDRIGHIVSDLLDFAKSTEPKVEPLEMGRLIEDILVMLSSQFTKKGISVKKILADPVAAIYADHSQIKQVLLNLFINSMEAMPHGGEIMVEVATDKGSAEGEKVILKMTDTGSGIREEDRAHLFEPFFTTKGTGTGLGLSICKRIIERHRGEISIESEYNKGTTVTLIFPVRGSGGPFEPCHREGT